MASSANSKQPTASSAASTTTTTTTSRVVSPYTLMKGFVTIQEEKELRKKAHKVSKDTN